MSLHHRLSFRTLLPRLFAAAPVFFLALAASAQIAPPAAPARKKMMVSFGYQTAIGGSVDFANLGTVPNLLPLASLADEAVDRNYHDGSVLVDAEAPQPGTTRNWNYVSEGQVPGNDTIEYHYYSAESTGFGADADPDPSYGFGIELAYALGGDFDRGFAWGFSAAAALGGFDASTSADFTSTLTTVTDVYGLNGVTPPAPPFASSATAEENYAIESTPRSRSTTTLPDGASLTGEWDISGAMYSLRFGPFVYLPLGDRWAARLSAGVSATYLGTDFTATEVLHTPTGGSITYSRTSREADWSPGAYADLSTHFWVTTQTALFAAARYHVVSDDFVQANEGRLATIDLSAVQVNVGFSFRF